MKNLYRFFFIILTFLLIIFSNTAYAGMWGKGELKLSKNTMQHLMRYLYGAGQDKYGFGKSKNEPTIFVVSTDGNWSYYQYCPYTQCMAADQPRAVKRCEKGSRGSPCYVMALKRRIVWKNGSKKLRIKKSLLKDPLKVAKAIKESGFYDGDIYKLAGIDYKSGQTTDEKKIIEKKVIKTKEPKLTGDMITQLKELKKLLDEGVITDNEFTKLKKKILN
tara:strand:+ start:453 stop:1109 length:657 start_codon:yes stop_codon:yes gene_type:complete